MPPCKELRCPLTFSQLELESLDEGVEVPADNASEGEACAGRAYVCGRSRKSRQFCLPRGLVADAYTLVLPVVEGRQYFPGQDQAGFIEEGMKTRVGRILGHQLVDGAAIRIGERCRAAPNDLARASADMAVHGAWWHGR